MVGKVGREVLRVYCAFCDLELNGSSSKTGPKKLENSMDSPGKTRGKGKLPLKYLAGLLDADGCITYQIREWGKEHDKKCVQVYVSFHQSGSREFIELVAWSLTPPSCSQHWGHIKLDGRHKREAWTWSVGGRHAVSVCNLLKKYLVIKRGLAEQAEKVNGRDMDREAIETVWRAADVPIVPKHPTTKWTAGYIDGDGSFDARLCPSGSAQIVLGITSEKRRRAGVELLQKQYGGSFCDHTNTGVELTTWTLCIDPAKFRAMFESDKGRLARSMVLKVDQVYFLLGCAQMGHFRDGAVIQTALRSLRIRPHRLSGPGAEVQQLLGTVQNLPPRSTAHPGNQNWRMRQSELAKAKLTDYEGSSAP
jgi:hypothetical protein